MSSEASTSRQRLRRTVPFGLRVGLRRLPAAAAWLLSARPIRGAAAEFPHVAAARATPLLRQSTAYAPELQAAKEHNVRRAAELLDGVVVPPGGELSWHRIVGPPVRARGFVPGPELHEGALALGGGGGACQAANLVFWLAIHAGQEVVERHRHGLDLFPDEDRTAPFGCGATVFYPTRDLRIRNPLDQPLLLRLWVSDGHLRGEARLGRDPGWTWTIEEAGHRFARRADGVWRTNRLLRRAVAADGRTHTHILCDNQARVTYSVPEDWLATDATSERP